MASVDDPDNNKKFAAEHGGSLCHPFRPEKTTAMEYGMIRTDRPPEQQLAARFTFYIGPDGKIARRSTRGRAAPVSRPRPPVEDTIKKLEALGVKKK